jgi:FAD/FMN-containing dehydrogenase
VIDPASLSQLRANLRGQLIIPDEQEYDTARGVFWRNPLVDRRPTAVARCAGPEDVARCIQYAAERNAPLAVRAGGHSFLGWGACDDGLVIDTTPIKEVVIDPATQTARVGGGVLTGELVEAAGAHELVAVQGQCSLVGVSGLTLGGGLGWLSGKHGASSDNLLAADVQMADGRLLTASPRENADLFWAIRGGGGNFGVVTSMTLQLYPASELLAGRVSYRAPDARRVLRFFREYMADAPDELQAVAILRDELDSLAHIAVCWSGAPSRGESIVEPLRAVAAPVADTIETRTYLGTFGMTGGTPRPFSGVKGSYLENISDDAIETALDRIAQAPAPGAAIGLDHYMHGAVCRVAPDATALVHRTPGTVHVWITNGWDTGSDGPAAMQWVEETWNALQAYAGGHVYANFPGAEGEPASQAAYGENYGRLAELKGKFDPGNLFQGNQNIVPAGN